MALITVTKDGKETQYKVKFVKDAAKGFELQYQDRWTWTPNYTLAAGESFTFTSTDVNFAESDANGVITAWKVSKDPVTITASVNGEVKDTLVINKINRAQIAMFLIVGQSNAHGTSDSGVNRSSEQKLSLKPAKGTAWCSEVPKAGTVGPRFDLSRGRVGFSTALSKTWYDLTGEKVFCIQSAVDGSPIECWEKDGTYYGSGSNLYNNTLKAYNKFKTDFAADNSSFEIIRTQYYWCQGETGMTNTWGGTNWSMGSDYHLITTDEYYNRYIEMHENFVKEMDVELGSIMLVRALKGASSAESIELQLLTDLVAPRAAQYAINNTATDNVFIASRICDIVRMESSTDKTSPGYGYMGPGNVHYMQVGYNAQGIELANNAFATINAYGDRTATELEVIAPNGRTRYTDGQTIEIASGSNHQIAAIVLPLYAEDANITYTVTKGAEFCSIDRYGLIHIATGTAAGSQATIEFKSEGGLTKTLNINVIAHALTDVTYRWEFDNLNEKNGQNNLTDSKKSTKEYTISGGTITLPGKTTDFSLAKPITLADDYDWSIEWKGQLNNGSALFGANGSKNNFIYLAYSVPSYKSFRIVTSDGDVYMIPYGEHLDANKEMNTWRVEHTIKDKMLTLKIYNETTKSWDVVGSVVLSTNYEFTITNLFGRYASGTDVCMNGVIDYVEITTKEVPVAEIEVKDLSYRWDFDDLNEKNGQNNLTDSERSTKDYTVQNGTIVVSDRTTDFKMAKPIRLSSDYDWSIEWCAKLDNASSLFGTEASNKNFLYLAYTVGAFGNPVRLVDANNAAHMIPYGDYVNFNTEMSTWKLEYSAESQIMTVKYLNPTTKAWETVGEKEMPSFKVEFTHMFGRYGDAAVTVCLNGTVDYIEVHTKEVTEK